MSERKRYVPITQAQCDRIFLMYREGNDRPEIVKKLSAEFGCAKKTIRTYLVVLEIILRYGLRIPITDEQWKKVEEELNSGKIAYSSAITRHLLEEVTRRYEAWERRFPETQTLPRPILKAENPHIIFLLQARDRLAEQVLDLPDPEEVLMKNFGVPEEKILDAQSVLIPSCLAREQLPPGKISNEPAFKWLREHTRDDPHWTDLEPFSEENGLNEGPWWQEYVFWYLGRLHNLVSRSYQACQYRTHAASMAAGNDSGPMVFYPFVVQPIREALRMHLGRYPEVSAEFSIELKDLEPGVRAYTLARKGEVIASGIDRRSTYFDDALVEAITNVYREFEKRILEAPEPREIVETWVRLKNRAEEFSSWLQSLTAEDLARTTCSACSGEQAKPMFPELNAEIREAYKTGTGHADDE